MNNREATLSRASLPRFFRLLIALTAWSFGALANQVLAEPVTTYRGICNASAGIDLGSGYFVVADDDINSLVVYSYGDPAYKGEVNLGKYLAGDDGKQKESDLEGAARIGNRIYWIASHAANDQNEPRPARQRLFATSIDTSGNVPKPLPIDAKPYTGLLNALKADDRFKVLADATYHAAETRDGLNIEGLAATDNGGLFIGFRGPLTDKNEALILELENPMATVEKGATPAFGELIRLDLGGRGVRSIERIGNEYLIVAGPYGKSTSDSPRFAIYKWNGSRKARPVHLKDIEPPDFHAEGIFEIAGKGQLYLLSDDGDDHFVCKEGKDSKKFTNDARKTFRGMAIDR
ncbi:MULTISPECIES: DUF3616 domain-containing protein [Caballeronia]|uniref:DUF3616 domain-containing protein n=1 Tax=Caballeronia jiangsuensis TaxID=1458357 RepID=A0ABW9CT15_9BURK|nr:DUF3616 domain-containing protein [Caballeronia sp. GaOx3]